MICFGHRGAMGHAAENTLESFELAIKQGVNSIELDVIELHGEAVVFHDQDLKRLCGIDKRLSDLSLQEVFSLKVLNQGKIPLLADVLDLVNGRVGINIELKSVKSSVAVAQAIKKKNYKQDDLLISSFNHRELLVFKNIYPNMRIGALQVSLPRDNAAFAQDLLAYSVHPSIEFIDPDFVRDAKNRGLRVFVFTVNEESEFLKMKDLSVDGVFTNYPDRFFKIFTRSNFHF